MIGWFKAPVGADGVSGPTLSTGTADVGLGVVARVRWGGLRADLPLDLVSRTAGRSGLYGFEWARPGDELRLAPAVTAQGGPALVGLGARAVGWLTSQAGPSKRALAPTDPSGWSLSAGWTAGLQLSRGSTILAHGGLRVAHMGQGSAGLEDHIPADTRKFSLQLGFAL